MDHFDVSPDKSGWTVDDCGPLQVPGALRKQFGPPCYRRTGIAVDLDSPARGALSEVGMLVAHLPGVARPCELTAEEWWASGRARRSAVDEDRRLESPA